MYKSLLKSWLGDLSQSETNVPEWIVISNIFLVEILTSKRIQDQEGIKGLKIVKGRSFLSFTDASIGVLQWSLMALHFVSLRSRTENKVKPNLKAHKVERMHRSNAVNRSLILNYNNIANRKTCIKQRTRKLSEII